MHNTISTTTQSQPDTGPALTPEEFGVGARITLSVMSDDYAEIILGALTSTNRTGLSLTTDARSLLRTRRSLAVIEAVSQATGSDASKAIGAMKKTEAVAYAASKLEGTRWLPSPLKTK